MSSTPKTPANQVVSVDKSRSNKRRRVVTPEPEQELEMTGEAVDMGDPFADAEGGETTLADRADEVFGVDKNWAGYGVFAEKDQKMKDRILQNFLLWLVFATAHEHDHQFGPGNRYDSKSFLAVSNFVIQQWQVRPVQIERYPSPGKTIRYLLTFEAKDAPQLLQILPRDWIKLSKGLGCRFRSPARELSRWQHLMIGGVPAHMTQKELERVVLSEEMLRVTVFTRVRMENGVATDKVYLAGEFAQEKSAVAENLKKEFSHKGCVLRLERRQVCSTCGEVDHIQSACGLRLRLQSPDMQEWAFVPVGILTRPADKPVKETGGKEQEMNPASGSKTRALVDGDKSGAPKLPSDNNRPAKKRKGNNKGKKGKN